MSIAEFQVYSVEEADAAGGLCAVRCIGGVARTGQVYAAGDARLGLRDIERRGHRVTSLRAGQAARVRLTGAMTALLTRGQVLTAVPPGGHALADLEAWLATDPPLADEPHPLTLRSHGVSGMQDDALPDGMRLRWGRVALAAVDRTAAWAERHPLDHAIDRAGVRAYLIRQFGPGHGLGGDPDGLCREVLDLIDLTPAQAAAEGLAWRDLPRRRIRHLRRIKLLLNSMAAVRPHLDGAPDTARAVDAWAGVRAVLP
ncbi:hypothetical protein [Streptomyces sp. NPDC090445]|uniref:hypothetical protein n=1 Tax=Streptomyces sp. NPDC090445 TaxID=3365963 RepID=UPI003803E126